MDLITANAEESQKHENDNNIYITFSTFHNSQFMFYNVWNLAIYAFFLHIRLVRLHCLVQVVPPFSEASIMILMIFTVISSWNAYLRTLLVTTRDTWRPLIIGLWTFASEARPQTYLLVAGTVIIAIPTLILYFLTQKQFTEGIAASASKG